MTPNDDAQTEQRNPYEVLGVPIDASDDAIRAAYLRKVKEYPPDRAPAEFERVRDAYEVLRDPRKRTHFMLLSADPERLFVSFLEDHKPERRFVGPDPWLAVVKER